MASVDKGKEEAIEEVPNEEEGIGSKRKAEHGEVEEKPQKRKRRSKMFYLYFLSAYNALVGFPQIGFIWKIPVFSRKMLRLHFAVISVQEALASGCYQELVPYIYMFLSEAEHPSFRELAFRLTLEYYNYLDRIRQEENNEEPSSQIIHTHRANLKVIELIREKLFEGDTWRGICIRKYNPLSLFLIESLCSYSLLHDSLVQTYTYLESAVHDNLLAKAHILHVFAGSVQWLRWKKRTQEESNTQERIIFDPRDGQNADELFESARITFERVFKEINQWLGTEARYMNLLLDRYDTGIPYIESSSRASRARVRQRVSSLNNSQSQIRFGSQLANVLESTSGCDRDIEDDRKSLLIAAENFFHSKLPLSENPIELLDCGFRVAQSLLANGSESEMVSYKEKLRDVAFQLQEACPRSKKAFDALVKIFMEDLSSNALESQLFISFPSILRVFMNQLDFQPTSLSIWKKFARVLRKIYRKYRIPLMEKYVDIAQSFVYWSNVHLLATWSFHPLNLSKIASRIEWTKVSTILFHKAQCAFFLYGQHHEFVTVYHQQVANENKNLINGGEFPFKFRALSGIHLQRDHDDESEDSENEKASHPSSSDSEMDMV